MRGAATLLVVLLATPAAGAAGTLPVQGVVRDNAGNPVAEGRFEMTFALYAQAEGGEPVWSATRPPGGGSCTGSDAPEACVRVRRGVFRVALGEQKDLEPSLFRQHDGLWLGVSVAGEPELPRRPLGSAGHAMAAAWATTAGGLDCTSCVSAEALAFEPGPWTASGGNAVLDDGRVGIGTGAPSAPLDVVGTASGAGEGAPVVAVRGGPGSPELRQGVASEGGHAWLRATEAGGSGDPPLALNPGGGRVGVGQTEPAARLDVAGAVRVGESDASCTAERAGSIRYESGSGAMQACVEAPGGFRWVPLGGGCKVSRKSCAAHLDAGCQTDGFYAVDPDGAEGNPPVETHCDMTTGNGGWTLVATWKFADAPWDWGRSSSGSPSLSSTFQLPFLELFPSPRGALLRHLPSGSTVTRGLDDEASWQTNGGASRYPTTDGNYLILADGDANEQGMCLVNGTYSNNFLCDGNSGQIEGVGLLDSSAQDEVCGCETGSGQPYWKSTQGGCTVDRCGSDADGLVALYLR